MWWPWFAEICCIISISKCTHTPFPVFEKTILALDLRCLFCFHSQLFTTILLSFSNILLFLSFHDFEWAKILPKQLRREVRFFSFSTIQSATTSCFWQESASIDPHGGFVCSEVTCILVQVFLFLFWAPLWHFNFPHYFIRFCPSKNLFSLQQHQFLVEGLLAFTSLLQSFLQFCF